MSNTSPIRVAIVEDHAMFLDLMADGLEANEDIQVLGRAERVSEAKKWLRPEELDVVVLDIELPDGNGIGLGKALQRGNPKLGVVLFSAQDMLEMFVGIPEEDRRGWSYLSKSSTKSINLLAQAIRGAARGETIIDPSLLTRSHARPGTGVAALTPRQFEILRAVARGDSNVAIAEDLGIAENTVGNHLITIYDVLGIPEEKNSRVTAVLEFLSGTSRPLREV